MATTKKSSRAARIAAAFAAFSITSYIVAQFAYYLVFSWFAPYDDEGYVLISLKLYRQGRALYDAVYSQYGPFYYEFMDALLSVMRQSVSHDAGRFITVGIWTGTSLLCGVLAFRLTRNLWIGIAVHLLAGLALDSLRNEAMHPGGLICLLVACTAMITLLMPARPRLAWIVLGALGAALMLIKINVGIFALLAIGFVALGTFASTPLRRVLLILAAAIIFCTPLLLMMKTLSQPSVVRYAIHVMAALLPLVVLEVVRPSATFMRNGLPWVLSGVIGMILVVSAIAMLHGTTAHGLVNGVLLAPLRQPNVLLIPLELLPHSRKFALILALCGIAAVLWKRQERVCWNDEFEGFVRVIAGLAMWLTVANIVPGRLGILLAPLAWIAALPVPRIADSSALAFARRFLPLLAVLQTLHAYPVAVSQIQWSAFLLIPVAAICVFDGGRQLARAVVIPEKQRIVATACGLLIAIVAAKYALHTRSWSKPAYAANTPLELPGSRHMRLPADQVTQLRTIAGMIQKHGCSTYFSGAGHMSFHFWTRREPPTGFQATLWNTLFDETTQRRVIRDLDRVDRLCILQNEGLISWWAQSKKCPLCDYLLSNYATVEQFQTFELMMRRPKSGT